MTDTRARQAAGDDVVAQLRAARVSTPYGDGVTLLHEMAAAAIEARDAEIARLREALRQIGYRYGDTVSGDDCGAVARAALAPPPASDGGEG